MIRVSPFSLKQLFQIILKLILWSQAMKSFNFFNAPQVNYFKFIDFQLSDQENAILEKQGKMLGENLTEDSQSKCVKYKFLKQFLNDIKQGEEQDLYLAFLIVIFFKVSIKDLIKLTYQRLITGDELKIHFKGDTQNIFHSVDDILKEVKFVAELELKQHNYKTMNDTIFLNQSERDIRRLVKKVILSLEEKNPDNLQYLDFISSMNLKNSSNLLKLKESTDNISKFGQINKFHQQLIPLNQNNYSFMNFQKQDDNDFNQSWSLSAIPREIQVEKQSKKAQSQQEKIQPFICLQKNQFQEEIIIIDDDVSKDLPSPSKQISQKIKQGKRLVNEKQIYNFSSQDLIKKQIKPNIKASIQNSDHQVYKEKPKQQQKQNQIGKIVTTQDVEINSQVIN